MKIKTSLPLPGTYKSLAAQGLLHFRFFDLHRNFRELKFLLKRQLLKINNLLHKDKLKLAKSLEEGQVLDESYDGVFN